MSTNRISPYTNKTFAEAFDKLFIILKELYKYPESLRPSMKKEKLPIEAFIKGARNTPLLTTQDNIQITIKPPPKTKPQYAQIRNIGWKQNLVKDNKITWTQRGAFKIEKEQFIVSTSSSTLYQEE